MPDRQRLHLCTGTHYDDGCVRHHFDHEHVEQQHEYDGHYVEAGDNKCGIYDIEFDYYVEAGDHDRFHFHFNRHVVQHNVEAGEHKHGIYDFESDYVEASDDKQFIYSFEFYYHYVKANEQQYKFQCERIDNEVDNEFLIVDSHVARTSSTSNSSSTTASTTSRSTTLSSTSKSTTSVTSSKPASTSTDYFNHKQVDFHKHRFCLVYYEPSNDDNKQVEHGHL
ncbi:unnamed protein product [Tilletia controversa]|nr:unnamed protein product [Tilletia controversa]